VLSSSATYDSHDPTLRVAFDLDGVVASDESESFYKNADGIEEYFEHEDLNSHVPLAPELVKPFLADVNRIQTLEEERKTRDPSYAPTIVRGRRIARTCACYVNRNGELLDRVRHPYLPTSVIAVTASRPASFSRRLDVAHEPSVLEYLNWRN
jgi:5'-nucleotidase